VENLLIEVDRATSALTDHLTKLLAPSHSMTLSIGFQAC